MKLVQERKQKKKFKLGKQHEAAAGPLPSDPEQLHSQLTDLKRELQVINQSLADAQMEIFTTQGLKSADNLPNPKTRRLPGQSSLNSKSGSRGSETSSSSDIKTLAEQRKISDTSLSSQASSTSEARIPKPQSGATLECASRSGNKDANLQQSTDPGVTSFQHRRNLHKSWEGGLSAYEPKETQSHKAAYSSRTVPRKVTSSQSKSQSRSSQGHEGGQDDLAKKQISPDALAEISVSISTFIILFLLRERPFDI